MKTTAHQTTRTTIADLYRALDRRHAITITYLKADDTETVRTIEPFDIRTTTAGRIVIRAMDRETAEARTFALDGITAYTLHRSAFQVQRTEPETTTPAAPVLRSAAQLVALELGRDYLPRTAVTHHTTALAA